MSAMIRTALAAVLLVLFCGATAAPATAVPQAPSADAARLLAGCDLELSLENVKDCGGSAADKAGDLKDAACEKAGPACDAAGKIKDAGCNLPSLAGAACKTGQGLADGENPIEAVATSGPLSALLNAVEGLTKAVGAIAGFDPANIAEEWAKQAAEGAVWAMDKVTKLTLEISEPNYDKVWWLKQYSIMFGLGLVVLAFLLTVICAKMGGPEGPVSAVMLLRESFGRAWLAPALMAGGPAILLTGKQISIEVARGFSDGAKESAGGASSKFIDKIGDAAGDSSLMTALGGGLLALLMLGLVLLFAFIVIVELMFASVGDTIFGLLVPLAIAMWVYPPWRGVLGKIVGVLLGLWLLPAAVNFVNWSVWGAAADGLEDNLFNTAVFVLCGVMMLASAPMIPAMLLPKLIPSYSPPHRYGSGGSSSGARSGGGLGSGSRAANSSQRSQARTSEVGQGPGGTTPANSQRQSKQLQPGKAHAMAQQGVTGSGSKGAGTKAAGARAGAKGAASSAGTAAAGAVTGGAAIAAAGAAKAGKSMKNRAKSARDHTMRH